MDRCAVDTAIRAQLTSLTGAVGPQKITARETLLPRASLRCPQRSDRMRTQVVQKMQPFKLSLDLGRQRIFFLKLREERNVGSSREA